LRRVTLPLASRGLAAGGVLAFARALGDFGATLMVAGNIPGRTQTAAIAIYDAAQSGRDDYALVLVLLLSAVAFTLLYLTNRLAA
jgi:molybdate transport system permease protein